MGRGGRKRETDEPERRCVATGLTKPRAELIRFVVGPDESVVPDLAEKLPGRGMWVSADRAALERASSKNLFSRGAKRRVTVPEGLADRVEAGLARRVQDLLSLARKAGDAIAGYEKVRAALQSGEVAVLIQASDGSERGKTKLRLDPDEGPTIGCLTAGELGLSFGRDHVIHAALRAGGLTTRIVEDAIRLTGMRRTIGDDAPERTIDSHERQ